MTSRKKVAIVGGVAGGASALAKLRRLSEDIDIVLFERGEYVSFANCGLPYYIGRDIKQRERLLIQTKEQLMTRYHADIRTFQEVLSIDRHRKMVTVKDLKTQNIYEESYDYLILSPGAKPFLPPLPGIKSDRIFSLRNMADMDKIDQAIQTDTAKHVAIIGGGYIGLEMTEALRHRNISVTLIEMASQVMAPIDEEMASLLHQELTQNHVTLRLNETVVGFEDENHQEKIHLKSGEVFLVDFVIIAIGVQPDIALAKNAGLAIGERGGIRVNAYLETSDPSIYAIGDAIEVEDFITQQPTLIPLAGPANRQARIAAMNILNANGFSGLAPIDSSSLGIPLGGEERASGVYKDIHEHCERRCQQRGKPKCEEYILGQHVAYQKTQGTGICKLFHLTVAMTGASEKTLRRNHLCYEKIYIHPNQHASYYPGASAMTLKLLFHPSEGTLLGAQIIGKEGVDKRIDLLALALRARMTVFDLEHVELAYAPPYGSAKDPIHYAGFVASNVVRGAVQLCHTEHLLSLKPNQTILDVRTLEELDAGKIENALHLPLDSLREKITTLDKNREYLVYCRVGLRGYLACRILMQHGFSCRNLSGGYLTYRMAMAQKIHIPLECPKATPCSSSFSSYHAVLQIDACGLQCPGPILQLKKAIETIGEGEYIEIRTSDPGFEADAPAWCLSTGHRFIQSIKEEGFTRTFIEKTTASKTSPQPNLSVKKSMTIVVFSGDFDKAMAAFIIANGALAMGYTPTLFFTFWGLNVLRKSKSVPVKKTLLERMFGFMMPKGAKKLALSKMNMMGMGPKLIQHIMKSKNVDSLEEMIAHSQKENIHLIACAMSMDLMGIKKEELIDGVEVGGVAMYLSQTEQGHLNLFI